MATTSTRKHSDIDANADRAPETVEVRPRRGQSMTRLETFTDAAFAFAAALLAISIDEVPESYPELIEALKDAPAFAASFAVLLLFWRAHQTWSDRYGLEDLPSVLLTFGLILVVMIYVYPLKIMFGAAFSAISNGWLPSSFALGSLDQFRVVLTVYGLGFFLLSGLISALYIHAWRLRDRLQMSPEEAFDTASESLAWFIVGLFGLFSILLGWLLPDAQVPIAAWIYCALIVYGPIFDRLQRKAARRRFG